MGLDLLGFRRKLRGAAVVAGFIPFGVLVMQRDVRVGDGGLLQVFIDAAAAAEVATFQLDGDAGAALHFDRLFPFFGRIVGDPVDTVVEHVLVPLVAGLDVFSLSFAVNDLRMVPLGVDLQLKIVSRFADGDFGDDLHRLAGREHAIHASGRDADPLLAAAHAEAMELAAVEELAEDQRDLLLDDARPVVLHADFEAVIAVGFDSDPDFGHDARFFASVEAVVYRFFDRG